MSRHRVLLRADASVTGGAGHVMRAIALGQECAGRGAEVAFACRSLTPMVRSRLLREAFEVVDLDRDVPFRELARERRANAVFADLGPAFAPGLLDGAEVPTLVVDDLGQSFSVAPSLVVNQNLHADTTVYRGIVEQDVLRGPAFLLFRDEFLAAVERSATDVGPAEQEAVLLTLGGTDPLRLLPRLATSLAEGVDARLDVVAPPDHPDLGSLQELAATRPQVALHHDVRDMTELMRRARLAVTSGGTTVWELAALGVPALVGSVAPIEDRLLSGLRAHGLFDVLGPFQHVEDGRLVTAVRARLDDDHWLRSTARLARSIVDGQGRRRVVDAMEHRS